MFKKKFKLILIIMSLILLVGCSKELGNGDEVLSGNKSSVEDDLSLEKGAILEKDLNDKYLHIVENQNDTGSIYYFREGEIVLLYGYHVDVYKIEEKSLGDNITYKLSTTEFGNPDVIINCNLTITQNEDKTVNMKWEFENGSLVNDNNLNLMNPKECAKSILTFNPNYADDRDWDEFNLTSDLFNEALKEIQKTESSSQISEEKALQLCKEKLKNVWSSDCLFLGTDEYGMDKILDINGRKYYAIYYIDEDMAGDFRFCVNMSSGEMFFQSAADLISLTPIEDYLQ